MLAPRRAASTPCMKGVTATVSEPVPVGSGVRRTGVVTADGDASEGSGSDALVRADSPLAP
jgi:hypothetical protein